MSVTNGFLRLRADEFEQLQGDEAAFAERAQSYDESNGYLDMDKAGYELLYILGEAPYPNLVHLLGGGQAIFPELDLGYGPAAMLDREAMRASIKEFEQLDLDKFLILASKEMGDADEEELREYSWAYLQALAEFVKEAVAGEMVVFRY